MLYPCWYDRTVLYLYVVADHILINIARAQSVEARALVYYFYGLQINKNIYIEAALRVPVINTLRTTNTFGILLSII